jgi:hypothetical protein
VAARIIGQPINMGPHNVTAGQTIARGGLVTSVSGLLTVAANAAVANIALAMDKWPDADYGGTKTGIDIAYLGEDVEIEMPFSGATLAATHIGGSFGILAADGGTVNLANTTNLAFQVHRLGQNTNLGATTGFLIGVILDSAAL